MESRFRDVVVNALFPRFCLGCHTEGSLWCVSCSSSWWPAVFQASCPFCEKRGSARTCVSCSSQTFLDGLIVFCSYANPVVREAILQWKYIGDRSVEPILEKWLRRAAPHLTPVIARSVFAPVPLHIKKRRARGFDQAGVLADWCGQIFDMPVFDLLHRVHSTTPQAQQRDGERKLGQLDHLFALHPSASPLPESVILCDDVFTSGATMDAAARCLKQAGVHTVWGIVIAKGNV